MGKAHFGLIGLGVMGENLVLNAERNGFSSAVYNRTYAKTSEFLLGRGSGKQIVGAETLEEFVAMLERPRRILMMVKAGQPIDDLINTILPDILPSTSRSQCRDLQENIVITIVICSILVETSARYQRLDINGYFVVFDRHILPVRSALLKIKTLDSARAVTEDHLAKNLLQSCEFLLVL